jgi:hypothetical protein
LLYGTRGERIRCDDEIDVKTDQFTRQSRKPFDLQARRSDLYEHVLTIDIAVFA